MMRKKEQLDEYNSDPWDSAGSDTEENQAEGLKMGSEEDEKILNISLCFCRICNVET